jgi:hypothetical protein
MKNSGFLAGLRQLGTQVDKESRKMRRTLNVAMGRGIQSGIKESKQAIKDLGGGLKQSTKDAVTFGGALGGAALIHNAMELQGAYAQIAFEMERATGRAYSVEAAQEAVTAATGKTKRTSEELATAMRVMLDRGANPDVALASLELVGHAMNATGQDAERVGRLVGGLSNKFNLTSSQGAAMFDTIIATATEAKVSTEEFMEDFNEFGSIAQAAGLKGQKGLQALLGLVVQIGPKVNGSTSEISSGLDILFERVRDMGIIERIFKDSRSKMKFKKEDFGALDNVFDQVEYLAKAGPEAMKLFQAEFTGREEKAAFEAMFGPYFSSLEEQLTKGVKKNQAHIDAMEDLRLAHNDMSPDVGQGGIQEQSARLQQTGAAKVRDAMNKFSAAMTQPQMLEAIDSMATSLPPLASAIAKGMNFVAKHPVLAAGAFAGAKIGGAFIGGAAETAGTKIGSAAGKAILKSAAGQSAWTIAGKALGVAAGAAVVYALGQHAIDSMYDNAAKQHGDAAGTEASALATAGSSDMGRKEQELQMVRAKIAAARDDRDSFTGTMGAGANKIFAALAGASGMSDGTFTDTRADSIAKLVASEKLLSDSILAQRKRNLEAADSGAVVARAMRDVATAATEASSALKGGGRGPVKPSHTGPGWSQ